MGGWLRILLILRLSQPSLAGVGAGAELGNKIMISMEIKTDAWGCIYRHNHTGFTSHSSQRCFVPPRVFKVSTNWSKHEILQGPKNKKVGGWIKWE